MDTLHDLGGKQGFGPIAVQTGDAPFDHDWERRMWGLARAGIAQGITIDWFRHGLERMVPADYLGYSYFQKWATDYMMLMVDHGTITIDDILAGHVADPAPKAPVLNVADVVAKNRGGHIKFDMPIDTLPVFNLGDTVRTLRHIDAAHTRLPAYARDCTGTIITYHGAHAFADAGALGIKQAAHLYTVSFAATELWGPVADPRDSVTLELWEEYLVRP